jgi:hypothetical protein
MEVAGISLELLKKSINDARAAVSSVVSTDLVDYVDICSRCAIAGNQVEK